MPRVLVALFGLAVAAFLSAPPVLASNHRCSDYPSQAAAQAAYRADPVGHRSMDADRDGIACESNRAPYDRNPVGVGQPAQPTAPPAATATPRPAATTAPAQPTPTPARASRLPDGWALVTRVIDGDTVDVQIETGGIERLRIVGIDTPETVDPSAGVECHGPEASATAKEWLPPGTWVWLEADLSQDERDRFGRLLRYLWLEDPAFGWWDFGYWMVADGHAYEYTYQTPYWYQAGYRAAEAMARNAGAGLWGPGTCNGRR